MAPKPSIQKIIWTVKTVVGRQAGKPASAIRVAHKLEDDLGLNQQDRFALAPSLNAAFKAQGFIPNPRLNEHQSEAAETVGNLVAYYRHIFGV